MAALAVLLLAEAVLAQRVVALGIAPAAALVGAGLVVGALAIVLLASRLLAALSLHYVVNAQSLTMVRGTARWVVPLAAVEQVAAGAPDAVYTDAPWLPGYAIGKGYVPDGGRALFFTSSPAAQAVAVRTADCTYLLSPEPASSFIAAVEERRTTAPAATAARPGDGWLAALRLPISITLALIAAAANVALCAYVAHWYPVLPTPAQATRLPVIGAVVLLSDLALATLPPLRRPAIAYVLLGAAIAVHILLWVALLGMLP